MAPFTGGPSGAAYREVRASQGQLRLRGRHKGLAVVVEEQRRRLDMHQHIDRALPWIGEGERDGHQIVA